MIIVSEIVSHNIQSVTATSFKAKDIGYMTPVEDQWRLPFLEKLLDQRRELWTCEEETSHIDELIESLCAS